MSTTNETFRKSKLTLRYQNKNTEDDYLRSIFVAKKMQMVFIMGLTFFIYLMYIRVDLWIFTREESSFIVPFHLSMIGLWLYLIPAVHYNFLRRFTHSLLYLMPIYAILGTLSFAYYYHNPIYLSEIYIILFWSFIAIGYMFVESVIVSTIMAILDAIILYLFNIIDPNHYIVHVWFMVGAGLLGFLASYLIELQSRHDYENKIEIIQMKDKLKELSHRDYLTKLYNRRYFNEISQDLLKRAKTEKQLLSVILLDIDQFKNINDTYGHTVGDEVIKSLAFLLSEQTRDGDIVSRFGGEEFVILLPSTDERAAAVIAEKLRVLVENQKIRAAENNVITYTISLGVDAVDIENDFEVSASLDRADQALYGAKETGRTRVVVYSEKSYS